MSRFLSILLNVLQTNICVSYTHKGIESTNSGFLIPISLQSNGVRL